MNRYKVSCVKNNEKVSLLIAGENIDSIKKELHKQGYSIIEIIEDTSVHDDSGIFYFDVFIDGVEKKAQKIKSNDILRAYIKLKDDLHYEVTAIYDNKEADEKEKILTTNKIKESYRVYLSENEKKKSSSTKEEVSLSEEKEENFLAKKEILNYIRLIDKVIVKISYILENYKENLSSERIVLLESLYGSLKQIKNITNINKLKTVWEKALLKIGEIEMELTDIAINDQKEDILQQTNQLLKEFWSSKKVGNIPAFESSLESILQKITAYFGFDFSTKDKPEEVSSPIQPIISSPKVEDKKNSITYYKSVRELNIYNKKLKEINILLLKAYITFDQNKIKTLELKKKLVLQNIQLIKNRFYNKRFSYTKLVKGFSFYVEKGILLLREIGNLCLYSIFFYSIYLIIVSTIHTLLKQPVYINTSFFFFVVLVSFFTFFSKLIKNIYLLSFFGVIYSFLFIFLFINL